MKSFLQEKNARVFHQIMIGREEGGGGISVFGHRLKFCNFLNFQSSNNSPPHRKSYSIIRESRT